MLVTLDGDRSSSEPFGAAWLEPSLGRLAKQAMDSSVRESFHQGDNSFVAVARKVGAQKALVVAFDLSDTAQSKGHARRDIGLAGQVTLRTGPLISSLSSSTDSVEATRRAEWVSAWPLRSASSRCITGR